VNGFLLDTNVLSEIPRPQPERLVLEWINMLAEDRSFVSVLSLGELRRGTALLVESRQRRKLEQWLEDEVVPGFAGRVLPVTAQVADLWGTLSAERQLRGVPLSVADGLIAATAVVHGLTLATRNEKDFRGLGLTVVNPWTMDNSLRK
jgi:predicted nucleic acid-binding protein